MKSKTIYIIIAAWLAFLLVSMLAGCRTVRTVEVHDTLRMVSRDTLTRYAARDVHDTLMVTQERTITVNQSGDTVRVVVWRDRWRDRWRHDTVTVYRAQRDTTARRSYVESKNAGKPPMWQKAVFFALCAVFLFYVVSYPPNRK